MQNKPMQQAQMEKRKTLISGLSKVKSLELAHWTLYHCAESGKSTDGNNRKMPRLVRQVFLYRKKFPPNKLANCQKASKPLFTYHPKLWEQHVCLWIPRT